MGSVVAALLCETKLVHRVTATDGPCTLVYNLDFPSLSLCSRRPLFFFEIDMQNLTIHQKHCVLTLS